MDHAVLQFGRVDGLLMITGLEDDFSLALEGGMLHFMHRLNHQLEKFLLIMFEGGLSSRGTIAEGTNFRNVVIIIVGNFFNASGSGVPDKKSLRIACSAGNFWPRMEVSMKGANSGKVLVLNPFVAVQQGSRFACWWIQ